MEWNELYPIVKTQAIFAILRYEEPERRKDKIQELLAMSFEKYQRDLAIGREIRVQDYKCFVTQRAKQVDTRSVCKKGYGGTSTIDVLGFYRRRPTSETPVVAFDDWMTVTPRTKELVEANVVFSMDYNDWLEKLSDAHKQILDYLIQGFTAPKIATLLHEKTTKVRQIIKELRQYFVQFFMVQPQHA